MSDKLIGMVIMVTDEGNRHDQAPYTESPVIGGMDYFYVRKAFTPLDPERGLSPRQENKQELDSSSFSYARTLGELMFLAGRTRPDISCIIGELSRRAKPPRMNVILIVDTATYASLSC